MKRETELGGPRADFPETRWSVIGSSLQNEATKQAVMEQLLAVYWKPLYFFVRRKGQSIELAKDTVQGFFLHLLERDFLANVKQGRGRFRGYLKIAISNYLANVREGEQTKKRGGHLKTISLDFENAEAGFAKATVQDPAASFDREWALSVMERALKRLQQEFSSGVRQGPLDECMKHFQLGAAPSYEQSATECRMSVSQFKAFLHRTRVRYRELLLEEVRDTVSDVTDADAELKELFQALA
jgi:DNA-directed RNA polymerase specialized sigma24 family protein